MQVVSDQVVFPITKKITTEKKNELYNALMHSLQTKNGAQMYSENVEMVVERTQKFSTVGYGKMYT